VTSDLHRRARPAWLLDELSYAGRENLDPEHATHYDLKEDADAANEVALLKDHGLTGESLVVEFGPGTGQFTVAVAPECLRVIAVDVSPPVLRRLEQKVIAGELANVDIVRAGFLSYVHAHGPADFIYSRFALHHLPDFWKAVALARLREMLKPAGILRLWDVVYDFDPGDAEDRNRSVVRDVRRARRR
jgi:SAM-dependent methyltransferase